MTGPIITQRFSFDAGPGTGPSDGPAILFLEVWPSLRTSGTEDPPEPPLEERRRAGERPLAILLVEQRERHRYDDNGRLCQADLDLLYRVILGPEGPLRPKGTVSKGCWSAGFYQGAGKTPESSLLGPATQGGTRFLDLPYLEGHRIGTYLMNRLVAWLQQWPAASVHTIHLDQHQADPENRLRRNRFYEQFGLRFRWTSDAHEAGSSLPMTCGDLRTSERWTLNIREVNGWRWMETLASTNEVLSAKHAQVTRALKDLSARRMGEQQHPFRFAARWMGVNLKLWVQRTFLFLAILVIFVLFISDTVTAIVEFF